MATSAGEFAGEVQRYMESHREAMFETLDALLRIESLPGSVEQNECLDLITAKVSDSAEIDDWCPDWDAVSDLISPIGRRLFTPGYPATEEPIRCLVASTGSGHPHLVLNAHVDVVPADASEWKGEPFSPIERDGRITARGALDMKSGLVAALFAFNAVVDLGLLEKGRLSLAIVPEEETGGNGTLACIERGHIGDAAIFTEYTGLDVVHRHGGIQKFAITARGREGGMLRRGHQAGVNAIDVMARVLVGLQEASERRDERTRRRGGYDADDNPAFINVGSVSGGDWLATRARECRAEGLFGILAEESVEDAESELRAAVDEGAGTILGGEAEITFDPGGRPGGELPADHPLVMALLGVTAELGMDSRPTRAGAMVCDAKILHGGGWAPAVIFGPTGDGLHGADEWVDADSVAACAAALALAAHRYSES
jgi:acetylornithine deacetylase